MVTSNSLLALLTLPLLTTSSHNTQLNIHIKIATPINNTISESNIDLSSQLITPSDQQLDFITKQDPHATLYLTMFDSKHITSGSLQKASELALKTAFSNPTCSNSPQMEIGTTFTASGAYAMLSVTNIACLQLLSDSLVNATSSFVAPYAKEKIPSWVYDLPPDQQQGKIDMIHLYGSPNVFESFDPHVTLLADSTNITELAALVTSNQDLPVLDSPVVIVGFGKVGPYGSVLKGQDILPPVTLGI